jgi:hypothetical protein
MNTFVPVFFLDNEGTKLGMGNIESRTEQVHGYPLEQSESRICIEKLFDSGIGIVHPSNGYAIEQGSYMAWKTSNLTMIC